MRVINLMFINRKEQSDDILRDQHHDREPCLLGSGIMEAGMELKGALSDPDLGVSHLFWSLMLQYIRQCPQCLQVFNYRK